MFGMKRLYYATIDQIRFCRKVTDRILFDMEQMRQSTEDATLRIGELLVAIVETATAGNNQLRRSLRRFVRSDEGNSNGDDEQLSDRSRTIADSIDYQSQQIADMIAGIQDCFDRQMVLARSATAASQKIINTAQQTSRLMTRSKLLAFNVQIEASRLGESGRSISVLGEEMKLFSEDVESANRVIAEAITEFVEEMPKLESETVAIGRRLQDFSTRFESEMDDVRRETQSITTLLRSILDDTESRNNAILKYSHQTLSNLQFQDPVAQGLRRAEHDVKKLRELMENRNVIDNSLADIADDVGSDGAQQQEAGEVVLF